MNGTRGLNANCVKAARAAGKDPAVVCTLPEDVAPHIEVPLFVMNSRFDPGLISISGGPAMSKASPAQINDLGALVLRTINATALRSTQNAAFITSCHEHCGQWSTGQVLDWGKNSGPTLGFDDFNVTIDSLTAGEALSEWYRATLRREPGPRLWLQPARYPCDACCHGGQGPGR